VISSSPSIPVGVFGSMVRDIFDLDWVNYEAREYEVPFAFEVSVSLTKLGRAMMLVQAASAKDVSQDQRPSQEVAAMDAAAPIQARTDQNMVPEANVSQ
jgi:hypothetical protein